MLSEENMQRRLPSKWDALPKFLNWEGGFDNPFTEQRSPKAKDPDQDLLRAKFNGETDVPWGRIEGKSGTSKSPSSPKNRTRRSFTTVTLSPSAKEIKDRLDRIKKSVQENYDLFQKLSNFDQQRLVDSILSQMA